MRLSVIKIAKTFQFVAYSSIRVLVLKAFQLRMSYNLALQGEPASKETLQGIWSSFPEHFSQIINASSCLAGAEVLCEFELMTTKESLAQFQTCRQFMLGQGQLCLSLVFFHLDGQGDGVLGAFGFCNRCLEGREFRSHFNQV